MNKNSNVLSKNKESKLNTNQEFNDIKANSHSIPQTPSIIIIGAGLAGWHVVDALRAKDSDCPITLITTDEGDRYHKPMLTMAISQNKGKTELIRATGQEAAKTANITLLAQTKVVDIDSDNRQVFINSQNINAEQNDDLSHTNKSLTYTDLVFAMGAEPIFPKSLPKELVWHVNHIEPFSQLQSTLTQGSQHVAIVGAGMVGTEIAEDLLKAAHQVTLMDLNPTPLAQLLPETASQRVLTAITEQGINFIGNCQVNAVIALDDGRFQVDYSQIDKNQNNQSPNIHSLIVDHVIASTGLIVDEHLPRQAGVDFDQRTGIVAHPTSLRTSVPNIYAIGDCMSIDGVACRYVAPLRSQASIIAEQILGNEQAIYQHKPPMIRLKNKAISVNMTGSPSSQIQWQIITETDKELIMEQHDKKGEITATLTVKKP